MENVDFCLWLSRQALNSIADDKNIPFDVVVEQILGDGATDVQVGRKQLGGMASAGACACLPSLLPSAALASSPPRGTQAAEQVERRCGRHQRAKKAFLRGVQQRLLSSVQEAARSAMSVFSTLERRA